MAEDIFRSAGFIKGVQYDTQQVLENGTRPDFTINLPDGKVIHMDSKFIWEYFQPLMDEDSEESEADSDDSINDFIVSDDEGEYKFTKEARDELRKIVDLFQGKNKK